MTGFNRSASGSSRRSPFTIALVAWALAGLSGAARGQTPPTPAAASPTPQGNQTLACTFDNTGCTFTVHLQSLASTSKEAQNQTVPVTVDLTLVKHTHAEGKQDSGCSKDPCATLLIVQVSAAHPPAETNANSAEPTAQSDANPGNTTGQGDPISAHKEGSDKSGPNVTDARISVELKQKLTDPPIVSSDVPAHSVELVVAFGPEEPNGFSGTVSITREDFGDAAVDARLSVLHVALRDQDGNDGGWFIAELAGGHTERRWITRTQYKDTRALGECTSARNPSNCEVTASIYSAISKALGRIPAREFLAHNRANTSEPIVLLVGLGGGTGIVLLDCRQRTDLEEVAGHTVCRQRAAPWSTLFERAPYFWAAYIEETDAPFRTSIDVEFRNDAERADYEEYDPVSLAGRSIDESGSPEDRVAVRIGFRRFRVRDAPAFTKVGFSREGQGYGLRQWVRTYSQYGKRRWGVAGGTFVSAAPATRTEIKLQDVYANGSTVPFAHELVDDTQNRVLFAYAAFRWYQWRERAAEMSQVQRLTRYLFVPDVVLGAAVPDRRPLTLLYGLSWPMPIARDRISFVLGRKWIQEDVFRSPYEEGVRIPLSLDVDTVREQKRTTGVAIGLAVDLLQWR